MQGAVNDTSGDSPSPVGDVTQRAARTAAILGVAEVIGKVATLAYTLVAARVLSQGDFGAFSYALALGLVVSSVPELGANTVVIHEASRDRSRLSSLFADALFLRVSVAVPTFLLAVALGASGRPDRESVVVLVFVVAATVLDVCVGTGRAATAALQRQVLPALVLIVQRGVTAVAALAALWSGLGVVGLSIAFFAGSVVGAVGMVVVVARIGVRPVFSGIDRRRLGPFLRRSALLGVSAVVGMALFRVDSLMLAAFDGDDAVAAYAVAFRLMETVLFLSWAVTRAIFPVMSAATDPAQIRRGVEQGIAALSAAFVPFGMILLVEGRGVLELLFGPPYGETSVGALQWLAISPLLFGVAFLATSALLARGRDIRDLLASLVALVANVVINLFLIPMLGPTGAAVATTASLLLQVVILLALVRREIGSVRLASGLLVPVGATLPALAVVVFVPGPLLVGLAAAGVAYAGAWYALASRVQPEQLAVVKSLLPGRSAASS